MSAFREFLDSLERILGQPVVPRGEVPLAPEPGPVLLSWELARLLPLSALVQADTAGRRRVAGDLYGREFTVWFPAEDRQPLGHVWALALWSSEDSGTHRPEVQAVCVTCTAPRARALGPTTIVSPAACVLRCAG